MGPSVIRKRLGTASNVMELVLAKSIVHIEPLTREMMHACKSAVGFNVNARIENIPYTSHPWTLLELACNRASVPHVRWLVNEMGADLNNKPERCMSPLAAAVGYLHGTIDDVEVICHFLMMRGAVRGARRAFHRLGVTKDPLLICSVARLIKLSRFPSTFNMTKAKARIVRRLTECMRNAMLLYGITRMRLHVCPDVARLLAHTLWELRLTDDGN